MYKSKDYLIYLDEDRKMQKLLLWNMVENS